MTKSMASSIQPTLAASSVFHCWRVIVRYQGTSLMSPTPRVGSDTLILGFRCIPPCNEFLHHKCLHGQPLHECVAPEADTPPPGNETTIHSRASSRLRRDGVQYTNVIAGGNMRTIPFALILIGLIVSGGCGKKAPPPVVLGHVATLSGPDKQAGEQARRGIHLA